MIVGCKFLCVGPGAIFKVGRCSSSTPTNVSSSRQDPPAYKHFQAPWISNPHTKATYFLSTGRLLDLLKRREKLISMWNWHTRDFFSVLMSKGEVFFIGTKRCKKFVRWLCCQKKLLFFWQDFFFEKKTNFFKGEGGIVGDMLNMYGWTVGKNRQLSLR